MEVGGVVSLENFDPSVKKPKVLDSPRSLEACRREGIDPQELCYTTLEEAKQRLGGNPDKDLLEIFMERREFKRQQLVTLLKQVRERIISDSEHSKTSSTKVSKHASQTLKELSFKKAKKQINVIKSQEEMRQTLEEKLKQKEELIAKKQKKRQQQIEAFKKEKALKQKANEERQRLKLEKQEKQLQKQLQKKQETQQQKLEEQKRIQKENEKYQVRRKKQQKLIDEERLKKLENLKHTQFLKTETKRKELENKEHERQKRIAEEQLKTQLEKQQKQKAREAKRQQVLEHQEKRTQEELMIQQDLQNKEKQIQEKKKQNLQTNKRNRVIKQIQKIEKEEDIKRAHRKQEYFQELTRRKLQEEDYRIQQLHSEKQEFINHNLELRNQIDKEKSQLYQDIEKAHKKQRKNFLTPIGNQTLKEPRKKPLSSKKIVRANSAKFTQPSPQAKAYATPPLHKFTLEKLRYEAKSIIPKIKNKQQKALKKLKEEEAEKAKEWKGILESVKDPVEKKRLEAIQKLDKQQYFERKKALKSQYQHEIERITNLYQSIN